jgi:hypothetical protein
MRGDNGIIMLWKGTHTWAGLGHGNSDISEFWYSEINHYRLVTNSPKILCK